MKRLKNIGILVLVIVMAFAVGYLVFTGCGV